MRDQEFRFSYGWSQLQQWQRVNWWWQFPWGDGFLPSERDKHEPTAVLCVRLPGTCIMCVQLATGEFGGTDLATNQFQRTFRQMSKSCCMRISAPEQRFGHIMNPLQRIRNTVVPSVAAAAPGRGLAIYHIPGWYQRPDDDDDDDAGDVMSGVVFFFSSLLWGGKSVPGFGCRWLES